MMKASPKIHVSQPQEQVDKLWLQELWQSEWAGGIMVSRGHVYQLADLQSLVAKVDDKLVGAATYRLNDVGGCELMSINATNRGGGIGTKLLTAVEEAACAAGHHRVWLITSNDNLGALRFYQRRGYRVTDVYPGAIDEARRIKPAIPLVGDHDIEIHDEIELAKKLKGDA